MIQQFSAAGSNLKGGWSKVFSSINSAFPNLLTLLGAVGVIIVVLAIAKYFWDKRRGGANPANLGWSLAVGGLLAAPALIIPILLGFADAVINAVSNIAGGK